MHRESSSSLESSITIQCVLYAHIVMEWMPSEVLFSPEWGFGACRDSPLCCITIVSLLLSNLELEKDSTPRPIDCLLYNSSCFNINMNLDHPKRWVIAPTTLVTEGNTGITFILSNINFMHKSIIFQPSNIQ